ncbi:MAG: hypothetical protein ACPGUC_00785, partial [Gammaproteobacteria bacterium]
MNQAPSTTTPCARFRRWSTIIVLSAALVQPTLDTHWINLYCTALAVLTTLITVQFAVRAPLLRAAFIPSIVVLGFTTATSAGALIFQSLYLTPISGELEAPVLTFTVVAGFQAALLLSL